MIRDLGLIDYREAYKIQKDCVRLRKLNEIGDSLILAEHNAIFTIGRTGKIENLLIDVEVLRRDGIEVIRTDRGGDITYHGPGQLMVYPIVDLKKTTKDLHQYLRDLEELVMRVLSEYAIHSERLNGKTGIWVGGKKVASIGVAASNWVTYHGVSINVNCDLSSFSMIYPCGMKDVEATSIRTLLGEDIEMRKLKSRVAAHFIEIFDPGEYATAGKEYASLA